MERALYNTVLAGIALDGKKFFYVNPLEVIPGVSGVIPTHLHALPQRPGWFSCACCPMRNVPNIPKLPQSLLCSCGSFFVAGIAFSGRFFLLFRRPPGIINKTYTKNTVRRLS